jgi:hypothetical protein
MTSAISALLDWLMDLTRPGADPADARAFVANPTQAASQAMGSAVTQAQLTQAAHAVVGPTAIASGGNPIQALQHTVADNHGIAFAPQRTFAPETNLASGNEIGSPRAGEDVQQGVGNVGLDFDFSDMTFGDRNTASEGSTINTGTIGGDVESTSVKGDGNIVGDDNEGANTGDITAGPGANVQAGGKNNDQVDVTMGDEVNTQAGGDVATNTGSGQNTQVGDIDASGGGAAGGAGGAGGGTGGGLLGIGNEGGDGGAGGAATGGAGGPVIIAPTQNTNSNNQDNDGVDSKGALGDTNVGNEDNDNVSGDQTQARDVGGNLDASHDDNSTNTTTNVDAGFEGGDISLL